MSKLASNLYLCDDFIEIEMMMINDIYIYM